MPATSKTPLVTDPDQFLGQHRRSHRASVDAQAVLFPEDGRTAGQTVQVLDLSLRGIGFRSPKCLRVGSTHRIDLHASSLHLVSRLQVMRCDQRLGSYEIGADFIED